MKIRSILFSLAPCLCCYANAADVSVQEIVDRSDLPLLNPDLADRKTAKLRLSNGLEILLISDAEADQSAAVMSVEVGSWSDPKEYPGMAHFCEHMLFMGSETYPNESEFQKMVTDYNGITNAYTASDRTVYMFSAKTEGFLSILDRFAHFFIDPLFDPSGISRELHAVDQEYAKNLEHDGWREQMVFKELGNPEHPNRGFNSGNSSTLKGIPQDALKKWHERYYGANRMHLAIYSPLSLEELTQEISSSFATVPVSSFEPKAFPSTITSEQQRGHITYVQPIKNRNILSCIWELPLELSDDPTHSAELIAYALNRGQKHNLYEKLKKEKLIDSMSVRVDEIGGKEHRLFQITLELTEKGVKELQTSVLRCFEALSGLRLAGVPSYLYQEKNELAQLFYQYQSRQDAFHFTMKIGEAMMDEPLETYPREQMLASHYDHEKIRQVLDFLTPEACVFSLLAPSQLTEVPLDKKEKWFGAHYAIRPVSSDLIALWSGAQPHGDIRTAPPNPFVPHQLALVSLNRPKTPQKIAENEFGIAYYCRAPEFQTPETVMHLHIRSPELAANARSTCLGSLYLDHLTDLLHPLMAAAHSAGLSTRFDLDPFELSLEIYGFSEKAPLLLQEILKQMPQDPPTLEEFNVYMARHKKDYLNSQKDLAVRQGKELLDSLLIHGKTTKMQKLKELSTITYEEFLEFHKKLFEKTYVEAIFGGNLSLQDAESTWLDVQHIFARTPYPKSEQLTRKVLSLPQESGPLQISQAIQAQGNATLLLLDQGLFTFENRAAQEILASALQEAFFDTLRTKQKTGYIASSSASAIEARLFQLFFVQSNSHQPEDLLYRFELFLETFHEDLETNISPERFSTLQASMIHSLQTRYRNVREKMNLWNMLAFDEKGNFDFVEERIQALQTLSYEKFLSLSKEFLHRKNRKRLAILCEGKLPHPFAYELITPDQISSIARYSARLD